jgi:hypothetical protein
VGSRLPLSSTWGRQAWGTLPGRRAGAVFAAGEHAKARRLGTREVAADLAGVGAVFVAAAGTAFETAGGHALTGLIAEERSLDAVELFAVGVALAPHRADFVGGAGFDAIAEQAIEAAFTTQAEQAGDADAGGAVAVDVGVAKIVRRAVAVGVAVRDADVGRMGGLRKDVLHTGLARRARGPTRAAARL